MQTIGQIRKMIKQAKEVCIQPRLGVCERWFKISKIEAMTIFENFEDDQTLINALDCDDVTMENGTLYLG